MSGKGYEPRRYRDSMMAAGMTSFAVTHKETDLWVAVNSNAHSPKLESELRDFIAALRRELEAYIARDRNFLYSLEPCQPHSGCPETALAMARAAEKAGVGPMAAVAGAFCQEAAHFLESHFPITDLIIENGGDIYLRSQTPRRIGIYAGASPLSNKVALEVEPGLSPLGICTSSGTVGHSLSFGSADAAVVLCRDVYLADAYATRIANMVKSPDDIQDVLEFSSTQPDILGTVIIAGERLGVRGCIKLAKA